MKTTCTKTMRSRFIEILLNNPEITSLPEKKMRETIFKILADIDESGIFKPLQFNDSQEDWAEELDIISDVEFDESKTSEEKKRFLKILGAININNNVKIEQEEGTISLDSLERIRSKRRELAKDPDSCIILTQEDYEDDELKTEEENMPNSYGRSPLHEAIAMRDLDSIRKHISNENYLDKRDNNGNTPYQMVYQEGYKEAIQIFKEFDVAN